MIWKKKFLRIIATWRADLVLWCSSMAMKSQMIGMMPELKVTIING